MTTATELAKFIGHETRGKATVAVFEHPFDEGARFVLNRASLESRLNNLVNGGWAHDQTDAALAGWPSQ